MGRKILNILMPFLPLIVTAAVIVCFAAAPALAEIPAKKEAPNSSELESLLEQLDDVHAQQAAEAEEQAEAETNAPKTEPAAAQAEAAPAVEATVLEAGTGTYEDGVYTGSGTGFGGSITVQVTVQNAQITGISILSAANETSSFLSRATNVIQSILTAQTWEVDAVSGATYSSNGIKAAVKNALTGEVTASTLGSTQTASGNSAALTKVSYTEPDGYTDGTYTGSAQGFGGRVSVQVTIADGQITGISVTSAAGETSAYLSRAKGVINRILSAQSPNVDTVSGATYSSTGIINAVKKALAKAAKSDEEEETPEEDPDTPEQAENPSAVTADTAVLAALPNYGYLDGTYTGSAEGFGGPVTVSLTVSGGQVTAISVTSAEGETPAYYNQALTLLPQLLKSQKADADAVTGATFSSNGILGAVSNALSHAVIDADTGGDSEDPEDPKDPTDTGATDKPDSGSGTGTDPDTDPDTPEEPEDPEDPEDPGEPEEPEEPEEAEPVVTTESYTETHSGSATVYPDGDEEFDPYGITVTVTVTVTVKTTVQGTTKTVETTRAVTGVSVSGGDATNSSFCRQALNGMKSSLIASGTANAVTYATCSSVGIRSAYASAMSGVSLGTSTTTETEG